jgi:hypothetical protein
MAVSSEFRFVDSPIVDIQLVEILIPVTDGGEIKIDAPSHESLRRKGTKTSRNSQSSKVLENIQSSRESRLRSDG